MGSNQENKPNPKNFFLKNKNVKLNSGKSSHHVASGEYHFLKMKKIVQ